MAETAADITDGPAAPPISAARASWDASMAAIEEGTRLYLTNDFVKAEQVFRAGMGGTGVNASSGAGQEENDEDEPDQGVSDDLAARDVRGAFALNYAMVHLLRGVASLSNDQLDECLSRLWEADRLASLDTNWVGKKIIRGVCTLCAGIVLCLQHNLVRGVYNILRSWQWIRYLRSEALEFDGVGASVVRSAAQLALGVFALILSLLPPHLIRAASWTTGFEIDREAGLELLRACQRDQGLFAPIAALGLLSFELDTKTFLGEQQTEASLAECAALIEWASVRYPHSVFFSLSDAELHACRHDLAGARAIIEGISSLPCVAELRALNAVVAYKRAVYHLAKREWAEAAHAFSASLEVYRSASRRSLSPAMAVLSALAHLAAGDREGGEAMMAVVATYKALDKSNWQRQDRMAFRLLARFRGEEEEPAEKVATGITGAANAAAAAASAAAASAASAAAALSARFSFASLGSGVAATSTSPDRSAAPRSAPRPPADTRTWATLQLAQTMTIAMRCTWWMDEDQCAAFVDLLRGMELTGADEHAQRCMILAQLYVHRNCSAEGLAEAQAGLRYEPDWGAAATNWGVGPMLQCLSAQLHAKLGDAHRAEAALHAISLYKAPYTCAPMISFKSTRLRRSLGLLTAETYAQISIAAGRRAMLTVDMQRGSVATVEWDWSLDGKDIDFSVAFTPAGRVTARDAVVPEHCYLASDGPCDGQYTLPAGCDGGQLILTWSNYRSYMRSKAISYRVVLPGSDNTVPKAFVEGD